MKSSVWRKFCAQPVVLLLAGLLGLPLACHQDEPSLAPYVSSGRIMSDLSVQESVYVPKISWIGGFASVLGINRDTVIRLDTSLVWLIHVSGDQLSIPVQFGQIPAGAEDITATYGGHTSRLYEDTTYTYWVMKADAWAQVAGTHRKILWIDSSGSRSVVNDRNDTLFINPHSFVNVSKLMDVWPNISDLAFKGRLADTSLGGYIAIEATDTSNSAIVTWHVASNLADSLVAAIGLVAGGEYSINNRVWEVLSMDITGTDTIYRKNNIFRSPVLFGQQFPGVQTRTYIDFPVTGLKRGQDYYFWIANKDWLGISRNRAAVGYAFATFKVW